MDRDLYIASSAGLASNRRIEVVSNNLANVSTVGFKAERLISRQQEFSDTLASQMPGVPARILSDLEQTPGVVDIQTRTDFSPGPIEHTGNPLNVALREANAFFVISTPQGDAYTRAGNFTRNSEGIIVTQDGFPVLGEGGPIALTPGEVRIDGSGTVTVDGAPVGRLRVAAVDDLSLLKRTEGVRFELNGASAQTIPADVVPESVELPNVSVVEAMIELISASKAFEAYTKTVRSIDDLNELTIRNASRGAAS